MVSPACLVPKLLPLANRNVMMSKTYTLLICMVASALAGCATNKAEPQASATQIQIVKEDNGIESAQRALPTRVGNVKQPAHYQHVYIDSMDDNAGSLQTIPLEDAVANNVLASSPLQVKKLDPVEGNGQRWVVMDHGFARPKDIEGVGGADVHSKLFSSVHFNVNETEILDKTRIDDLLKLAARVSGIFYVVGYADETGIESKNLTLSKDRAQAVADALIAGGVNETRVKTSGAGVSRLYPTLAENRHASITFRVLE